MLICSELWGQLWDRSIVGPIVGPTAGPVRESRDEGLGGGRRPEAAPRLALHALRLIDIQDDQLEVRPRKACAERGVVRMAAAGSGRLF